MTETTNRRPEEGEEPQRVVVRDRRRIDPDSGAVRDDVPEPADEAAPAAAPGAASDVNPLQQQLDERTADLQRLKAEFDNYRKRVERDRVAMAEQAVGAVLVGLLPVLDDLERARHHGELEGAFKSVADALESTVERLGLQKVGAAGDPFDPTMHEAATHSYADDVSVATCVEVLRPGYRLGERLLRPAMVAVAEPTEALPDPAEDVPATE
jgi:molecular chaperone GrpE